MNENSEGFQEDLDKYQAKGRIEEPVGLALVGGPQEIGSTQSIAVATGGRKAFLQVNGNVPVEVDNNSIHELPLLEARPYLVTLLDQHQRPLAETRIVPKVIVPQLTRLSVVEAVTYADPTVRVDLQALDVEQIEATWRMSHDEPWQSMDCASGSYFAPVLPRTGVMQIRFVLRSRHAQFCKEARPEICRKVSILHPSPTATCTASNRVVLRYESVACEIDCAWTSQVRVEWEGGTETHVPDRDHRVLAVLSLNTKVLGKRSITVHMLGLDGRWHQKPFEFDVKARPTEIAVSESGPGRLKFDIKGAVRAYLRIPARNLQIEVPFSLGTIAHEFVVPVAAVLLVIDDEGKSHERRVVLGRPPHLRRPF